MPKNQTAFKSLKPTSISCQQRDNRLQDSDVPVLNPIKAFWPPSNPAVHHSLIGPMLRVHIPPAQTHQQPHYSMLSIYLESKDSITLITGLNIRLTNRVKIFLYAKYTNTVGFAWWLSGGALDLRFTGSGFNPGRCAFT